MVALPRVGICWTHTILAVDLTGDGRPDIVTADYTDGGTPSVSVLLNQGGSFNGRTTYALAMASDETEGVTAGDFDLDGDVDLAAWREASSC